jgi:CHAT domain-containing protein
MRHLPTTFLVLLLGTLSADAAAPPARPRNATAQEQQELEALRVRLDRHAAAAEFDQAARLAEQIAVLRARLQGARHWQAIDARLEAQRWSRRTKIPAGRWGALARALALLAEADRLGQRPKSAPEANAKQREALDLLREALGEEHPEIGLAHVRRGIHLQGRGKYAEAMTAYEKALTILRKALGDDDFDVARCRVNVASLLQDQGKFDLAEREFRLALAGLRKALGEGHPETARGYGYLAVILDTEGKHGLATPMHEKALAIRIETLGAQHADTARSYNGVGVNLYDQGKTVQAQPLLEKALAIRRKALGEENNQTASSYNNLAANLAVQGKFAEAQPLYDKSLDIYRKVLGEEHPYTALAYNNAAYNLNLQGKYVVAQPLLEKSLDIRRKTLGEQHPFTALGYNNVAANLNAQGKHAQAQPLLEKALASYRAAMGEKHPFTANGYNNLAGCLASQRKRALAESMLEKAVAIRRKVWGEEHPETALAYQNAGDNLYRQDKYAAAQPLLEKALAIRRSILGEEHPDTGRSYHLLALNLHAQGKLDQAVRTWQSALAGQDAARFQTGQTGFDRALAFSSHVSAHSALAIVLARMGKSEDAFRHAESSMARGLLDDLASPESDRARLAELPARLQKLDSRLLDLLGRPGLSADQRRLREELIDQRRLVLAETSRLAAAASARQVLPLERIQQRLPPDSVLVFWLGIEALGTPVGCVVRREGPPSWQVLRGTGKDDAWTNADWGLPVTLYRTLIDPDSSDTERARLVDAVRQQYLGPLEPYLQAKGSLPVARRLFVVPLGPVAWVPVEVLSSTRVVSYVPSGSVLARAIVRHRPLSGDNLLALGNPTFSLPGSPAAQRGTVHRHLPGTAIEVNALAGLVEHATILLGSEASEQALDTLRESGRLTRYRLLHFATHGEAEELDPDHSRLVLAGVRPSASSRPEPGKKVYTGELTVQAIRSTWKLDADLVVLSACQTGLGKEANGDGLLGFAHAFQARGARSVVLSRWKVDDSATALLMMRFYENLLGKREGLKAPMPKAEALREAKQWLRTLAREDAEKRLTKLLECVPRGERGSVRKPLPRREAAGKEERPFEHPYYWAAFVLIGDPN